MKIALVIERMDTDRGGREASTAQIAAALARRGHDVTVLCQSGLWQHEGVKVIPLGVRGITRGAKLKSFARDVRGELEWGDYDIVHGMAPVPGVNVYQLRSGTIRAQRDANRRRRGETKRFLRNFTEKLNRRQVLAGEMERQVVTDPGVWLLPVSRMVAGELQRYYQRTDGVRVVFNAVDVPALADSERADHRRRLRAQMDADDETVVFLTVATNWALKGVAESIAAFAKWHARRPKGPNARLVLLGRDDVEDYRQQAAARDLTRHVVFAGSTENVAPWYAAADACVLLSWYDPCSRVVLEAMRLGLPSITTAFNGAAEALTDGAGLVVPSPADAFAIAEAFEAMYDNQRRNRAAQLCRMQSERLAVSRHVDELLAVYAEVIAS
ncbi:MAG: glycosyltransferase family 4 protein [Phycisphaerae bacterium]|nr:glycosyltransferase family 4 protein [Phycisphaerae bacterium]